MKKNLVSAAALSALLLVGTVLTSCDKDEDTPMPVQMTSSFSIENVVSAKDFVESGTFVGVGGPGVDAPVVLPGSSIKFSFSAGKGHRLCLPLCMEHRKTGFSHRPTRVFSCLMTMAKQ